MKIRIRADGFRLRLWLPDSLLKSRLILKKLKIDIDRDIILRMYKEFKKVKKQFRGLELVHVESNDGSIVTIKL